MPPTQVQIMEVVSFSRKVQNAAFSAPFHVLHRNLSAESVAVAESVAHSVHPCTPDVQGCLRAGRLRHPGTEFADGIKISVTTGSPDPRSSHRRPPFLP